MPCSHLYRAGRQFHYKVGEEILRLTGQGGGSWIGQLLWRNTAGLSRWQAITMRMNGKKLHGISANEHCYEFMTRPR